MNIALNIETLSSISLLSHPSSFLPLEKDLISEPLLSILKLQYLKNFGMIKEKYKRLVPDSFDLQTYRLYADTMNEMKVLSEPKTVKKFYTSINRQENSQVKAKIYCFLCSLAFVETLTQKFHETYLTEDWKKLESFCESKTLKLNLMEVIFMKDHIFKKNIVNYNWSNSEDQLLEFIVRKHMLNGKGKLPWQKITNEFNQSLNILQIRSAAHCRERWVNTLQSQFRKGNWTKQEDLNILRFVLEKGTKWSVLAKESKVRTEHNLKNRFFGLLSTFMNKTTRTIKKQKEFLNAHLLKKTIESLQLQENQQDHPSESYT